MPRSTLDLNAGGGSSYGVYVPRDTSKAKAKKKGGGILGALKTFGATTLKALTVPGAVAVTGINAATGGDTAWSDLGGAFTSKDGKGAGYKLVKRFGASDRVARIAGLAPEILLDPTTYLTGGLAAGSKLASGASRLEKLAELKSLEQTARTIVGSKGARAVIGGGKIKAVGLSPKAVEDLTQVARQANAIRRELEVGGGVPVLRLGVGRKTVKVRRQVPAGAGTVVTETPVKVGRGIEVRLGRSARFKRDPTKGGVFRMSPKAKEAQRNIRAITNLRELSSAVTRAAMVQHNITDAELAIVREYVALKAELPHGKAALKMGRTGPKQAESYRRMAIEDGLWRPELDALAEAFGKMDRENAEVLGLKVYEDQLRAFADVTAAASQEVKALEAAKAAEIAGARAAAGEASTLAAAQRLEKVAAKGAAARMALDEVDAALASNPANRSQLLARRKALRRQVADAERAAGGLPPIREARRIEAARDETIAKIEARYAAAVPKVWDDAANRFAVGARLGGYAKPWGIKGKAGAPRFDELEAAAGRLATVEGHFTSGMSPEMMQAISKYRAERLATEGPTEAHLRTAFDARGAPDVRREKRFTSPVNWTTETRYIQDMVDKGVPEEFAIRAANYWRNLGAKFATEGKNFWPKTTVPRQPDVDFFRVMRRGQQTAALQSLEVYTRDLLKEAFPLAEKGQIDGMIRDIAGRWDELSASLPTSMRRVFTAKRGPAAGESRFAIGTTWLKLWYTAFNPIGHYTMNAAGSLANSLIEGSRYHWTRGALGAFGFATRKLGKMDPKTMEKVYKVGQAGELTGLEVHVLSAISGLGAPYHRGEIANVIHLINDTKEGKHRWLARHLNNFQMDRENADRLYSFMNHLRNGDDVFTAGSKVVRYAFDYDQLTAFEKVWMRNLLIFYTWFRKNLTFQGYGMMVRPGAYAALAKAEAARPKKPGEPEWWAKAGGIGTPMGLLTFGNPYADVFKYSADFGDARRTIFGSLNPFVKIPIELGTDTNVFTGAPIEDSTPGRLRHIGESVMGPQGKLVQTAIKPAKPGQSKAIALAGRFLGPKIQQDDPAGNARRLAIAEAEALPPDEKRKAAAKKAAETRKRRQLERYNQVSGERP